MCDMQAVAVSSMTEAPTLAFDCARHGNKDDDDEDHDRKGWAKDVTEKEVMLNPEQEGTVTTVVRQGDINTETSVMLGEDMMVFWLFHLLSWYFCSFDSKFFLF